MFKILDTYAYGSCFVSFYNAQDYLEALHILVKAHTHVHMLRVIECFDKDTFVQSLISTQVKDLCVVLYC